MDRIGIMSPGCKGKEYCYFLSTEGMTMDVCLHRVIPSKKLKFGPGQRTLDMIFLIYGTKLQQFMKRYKLFWSQTKGNV